MMNLGLKFDPLAIFSLLRMMNSLDRDLGAHKNENFWKNWTGPMGHENHINFTIQRFYVFSHISQDPW